MRTVVLLMLATLAGCLKPSAFQCGDGRTCPADTTCDDVRGLCLSAAQTTACNGIANGKPCDADGTPGICDSGFCEPGCGDGVTDTNEQCDDGNFASHDGCSSRCVVEIPSWVQDVSPWHGVTQLSAAYHPGIGTGGRILVFGGLDASGVSQAIA